MNTPAKTQGKPQSPDDAAQKTAHLAPELQSVVDAWPTLPEALRAGILAMVRAAGG